MPEVIGASRPRVVDVYIMAYPGWQDRDDGLVVTRYPPSQTPDGSRLFRVRVPIPAFGGSVDAQPLSGDFIEIKPTTTPAPVSEVGSGDHDFAVGAGFDG